MLGEQLLIKMWETITKEGIGSLASPWQIRREGSARTDVRREELLMLAQVEVEAQAIREGKKQLLPNKVLVDRSSTDEVIVDEVIVLAPPLDVNTLASNCTTSITSNHLQEEINLNKTIIFAEQELENDQQEAPTEEIDSDWTTRWRDNAKKVKSEELQRLWARTLAGEVKSPGTYSLRTLDFIKNISQEEAIMISKLAPFVIENSIYKDPSLDEAGVNFNFLLEMDDLTIVSGVKGGGLQLTLATRSITEYKQILVSKNKVLIINSDDKDKKVTMECYKVTKIGIEILTLGDFHANETYLTNIGNKIKAQGFNVKIADWVQTQKTHGQYTNSIDL